MPPLLPLRQTAIFCSTEVYMKGCFSPRIIICTRPFQSTMCCSCCSFHPAQLFKCTIISTADSFCSKYTTRHPQHSPKLSVFFFFPSRTKIITFRTDLDAETCTTYQRRVRNMKLEAHVGVVNLFFPRLRYVCFCLFFLSECFKH